MTSFSPEELMVVEGARRIRDGSNVIVGIGLPMASAILAKKMHAPRANIFFELGVVNPMSSDYGVGLADIKAWQGADAFMGALEVLGFMLQGGRIDVGFLGALEVDQFGNINTTQVKVDSRIKHFTGSGGGNDIASLAKKTIVIMKHQKRKFPKAVAYITSPGYVNSKERREMGIRGGDIEVITDLAVLRFDKNIGKLTILSVHPGVSLDDVVQNTGFELELAEDIPPTPEPTQLELEVLRNEIPRELYAR